MAKAVVLGAGGSALAVVDGLVRRGIPHVQVANRTSERAEAVRDRFGAAVEVARWDELDAVLAGAGLLVNTTSLGMAGGPGLEVDLGLLRADAAVADLVYVPLETELLAQAKARGLRVADGLGMLLYQAVRGFSLWFGVTPAARRGRTRSCRKLLLTGERAAARSRVGSCCMDSTPPGLIPGCEARQRLFRFARNDVPSLRGA